MGEVRGDAYAQMQMVGHYDMAVDGDLRELALPLAEGLVYGAAGREWDGVGDGSLGGVGAAWIAFNQREGGDGR